MSVAGSDSAGWVRRGAGPDRGDAVAPDRLSFHRTRGEAGDELALEQEEECKHGEDRDQGAGHEHAVVLGVEPGYFSGDCSTICGPMKLFQLYK